MNHLIDLAEDSKQFQQALEVLKHRDPRYVKAQAFRKGEGRWRCGCSRCALDSQHSSTKRLKQGRYFRVLKSSYLQDVED